MQGKMDLADLFFKDKLLKINTLIPSLETSEWCMIFLPPAIYWIYSTLYYILSHLKLTSLEIHKIPTDQKMRPANHVTVRKVLSQVFIQHVVQCITGAFLVYLTRPDDIATRPIEPFFIALFKLAISALLLDTYQYWWHRFMHKNKWLYRNFHSVHHQLTVPYAFGALYNHPVEGFIMDTLGGAIPAVLLDLHPWTAALFFSIATFKTVDDHCGYTFPWNPLQFLFPNNSSYHDVHHWGKGRMYNFSQPFFTFWDVWMGTDYEIAMKKKQLKKLNDQKSEDEDEQKIRENKKHD